MNTKLLSTVTLSLICVVFHSSAMLAPATLFKNSTSQMVVTSSLNCNSSLSSQLNQKPKDLSYHRYQRHNYCIMPTKDFYTICKALEKPVNQNKLLNLLKNTKGDGNDLEKLYEHNNQVMRSCHECLSKHKAFIDFFKINSVLTIIGMPILIFVNNFVPVQSTPALIIIVPIMLGSWISSLSTVITLPFFPLALINKVANEKSLPIIQKNHDILRTLMTVSKEKKLTLYNAIISYQNEKDLLPKPNTEL